MPTRNTSGLKRGGPGRPKGARNKATRDIKAWCQALFERPAFQKNVKKAWDDLTLDPSYRALLTHYAYGKPAQSVILDASFDPAKYLARPDEADHE